MMNVMQQQQQQNQQFLQQFLQQFGQQQQQQAQANVNADVRAIEPAGDRRDQAKDVRLPEFAKLAPEFDGKSSNPVDAKNWVGHVEKAFAAFEIPDRKKTPMAEFQLKDDANVWWQNEKVNLPEPVDWNGFKVLFYKKYFPRTIRNQMLSQLWALKQGNRSVADSTSDS